MERRNWTRDEHLIAFNLYCKIPFGKIHSHNPQIVSVAAGLNRSPDALAMKMVNFARLDPAHKARGVGGLSHGSRGEEEIWEEFMVAPQPIAIRSEEEIERLLPPSIEEVDAMRVRPTETTRTVQTRLVQSFFRGSVLASYNYSCSFCGLAVSSMLIASHIIPWSVDTEQRANPSNGLCLCSFHDRAFDRGLMSVDENLLIIISSVEGISSENEMARAGFISIAGSKIREAERFKADPNALAYHRKNIFRSQ